MRRSASWSEEADGPDARERCASSERSGSDDDDEALDVSEELARPAFFVEAARRASAEAAARASAAAAARGGGAADDAADADVEDGGADADGGGDGDGDDDDDGWNEDASWEEGWGGRARTEAAAAGRATTSRMAMLPTSDPIARAPWRARLPHFVPVCELAPHAFHEGEIVHVDYVAQFGGAKSKSSVGARGRASASEFGGARAATAPKTTPRWYTDELGRKTFVDDRGVARVGAAAYRASQKSASAR